MSSGSKEIQISVVIPVWNEEENIKELYVKLTDILVRLERTYEIVFVDDGSREEFFELLRDLHQNDRRVRVIRLLRNFGQAVAFLAGFEYVKGKIIVTMDSDLQYAPEDLPKLIEKIDNGFEAVSGYRVERYDSIFRRIASCFMNKIMRAKTGIDLRDWGCSLNAAKKELVSQLKNYGRTARFTKPIIAKLAKSMVEVEVNHYPRKKGKSRYGLLRLIKIALDFLVFYSPKPSKENKTFFIVREIIE